MFQVFTGNTNQNGIVSHDLVPPILAQYIRINPVTWSGAKIGLRLELYGCTQDEQQYCECSSVQDEGVWR